MALLVALKRLERAFGRGQGRRWGPRELDLDLLVFGRHRIHAPRPARARSEDPARGEAQWLEVPHASLHERLFMLAPLADLAARLVPPGWSETVAAAARRQALLEGPDAVRQVGAWDASERRWRPDADDGPRGR
jgi:7,8-dihydro-6-hydroxymethylpterin-pyrophosphokinase